MYGTAEAVGPGTQSSIAVSGDQAAESQHSGFSNAESFFG